MDKLPSVHQSETEFSELARRSVVLVQQWLHESSFFPADANSARLAGLLRDPEGLAFTVEFIDGVVRPDDVRIAARTLNKLSAHAPVFLPLFLRLLMKLGGNIGLVLPWLVIPATRKILRRMVGHLITDARPEHLSATLLSLKDSNTTLNLNLLGEAVLGDAEAKRRLLGIQELLLRDDVQYVSVKISAVAAQLSMWAFDETVERVVQTLRPLFRLALPTETRSFAKFINLDMEEYRDLDLTIAVFQRLLDSEEFMQLEAGIVLQAYLPDALGAMQKLQSWAAHRRARGGAAIKVRVVKGANLSMEKVDAIIHGWPLAPYETKQQTDTNYKKVLNWALTPERMAAVRIGVASHNLFDIAFIWLLACERGVEDFLDFEMLAGMSPNQTNVVRKHVGKTVLYTPVVHPRDFIAAISYLVRRLEENASSENFLSAASDLESDELIFARERDRFLASVHALAQIEDLNAAEFASRRQDRNRPSVSEKQIFVNAADTDTSLSLNREWARTIARRSDSSQLGEKLTTESLITDPRILDDVIESVADAGKKWGHVPAAERSALLRRAGYVFENNRGLLLEVMASETGKTLAEADSEVSEAIDFAYYYAECTEKLSEVEGATFVPSSLTVVTPPWNFPVAIPAGSTLAALAAGSAVLIKPAPQARRCAAVMVDLLWQAGFSRDVLALVNLEENDLGQQLITHPMVDQVILTGSSETAKLFRSWRPDLVLFGETSGKNAIVVTPSADFDLAIADIVKSAFGHAGQKCSAASLVILVGSVGRSGRFMRQLVDAVTSLRVGYPDDLDAVMGPLIEPADGKLLRALITLEAGEQWLVRPRQCDDSARLWSPGVRKGVAAGSFFHLTEFFGPVLGIMQASSLKDAIKLQNGTSYGLTAGLHSLDSTEIAHWIDAVEAGNLYVNRGITGAIVRRQPFGGWKGSSVGGGTKAGGPNALIHLGRWKNEPDSPPFSPVGKEPDDEVASLLTAALPELSEKERDVVFCAAQSDYLAWEKYFSSPHDVSGLDCERNVFRYCPVPVVVRFSEGGKLSDLVRVLAAGTRARSALEVSSCRALSPALAGYLQKRGVILTIENEQEWFHRISALQGTELRIRLIGGDATQLARVLQGDLRITVYSGEVVQAGRIELLPFVREQAISMTNHRFGAPSTLTKKILIA